MLNGFVRPATVRAQPGNDNRLGTNMVFGVGFLEIQHIQAGKIQDIDGHRRQPKGANCILWPEMGKTECITGTTNVLLE